MFKTLTIFTSLLLALNLSACSSHPGKGFKQDFRTRISDSGLKHFELAYQRAGPPERNDSGTREGRGRTKDTKREFKRIKEGMTEHAQLIITENQYCREGFWVIDFNSNTRSRILRGECNELASVADKAQFPDTLSKW